ncbi:MAG: hypothetical protein KC503_21170 [Myxococcales bacterium]|nr:hypothetical protein [Myxococcales bacterium]
MEKAEFEKKFLSLVNQSDLVITAPNVAYHLGLSIDEVQEHLLSLELNGTLQQKTDTQGNTYYDMPNRPPPGTPRALTEGQGADVGGQGQTGIPGVHNPAEVPHAPIYSTPTSAPASGGAVNGLVLNCIIPGLGSLIAGRMIGLVIMAMVLGGFVMFFVMPGFTKFLGVLPILIGWIWSVIAGIGLMNVKEKRGPGGGGGGGRGGRGRR